MFIDDILEEYPEMIRPHGVFRVQNVADYVCKNIKVNLSLEDFLNFRIPFEKTWIEFVLPPNSENELFISWFGGLRCGIFLTETIRDEKNYLDLDFYGFKYGRIVFFGSNLIELDEKREKSPSGRIVVRPGEFVSGRINEIINDEEEYIMNEIKDIKDSEMRQKTIESVLAGKLNWYVSGSSLQVVIMFLNFIGCRNVEIVKEGVPSKLIKKRQKKNKPYFEKFYTLQIEPIRKILNTEGRVQETGIKKALHICRGHFSHYEQKGLFGKYFGTFWVPAHIRGSSGAGKVFKDYDIKIGDMNDKIQGSVRG